MMNKLVAKKQVNRRAITIFHAEHFLEYALCAGFILAVLTSLYFDIVNGLN